MRYHEIILRENAEEPKFYHGSRTLFKIGTILRAQTYGYVFGTGEDRVNQRVRKWCEYYLEVNRPRNAIPRKSAVFLVDDPSIVELVGGCKDHVYLVKPRGPISRCNLYWFSEMESYCFSIFCDGNHPERIDEYDTKRIAQGYWSAAPNDLGEQYRDKYEYLVGSAEITGISQ